jgi:phage tail-like protein
MRTIGKGSSRIDPYRNFRFRIVFDGRAVAGVSKVSALKPTSEIVGHRASPKGNTPSRRSGFDAVTLERGETQDSEFEQWASQASNPNRTPSQLVVRRDLVLESFDEAGKIAARYRLFDCWVSEYQALPDLDANANSVLIAHLKLENQGWQRDRDLTEPVAPILDRPAG